MTGAVPRGRYAPSPTGDLHLGNAATALLAWLSARSAGGAFVLRVEDIDGPRVRPGTAERIGEDLAWLGLDWDEGPDRGGPFAPYVQSARLALYDAAFEDLKRDGRVYPCFCSRKEIAGVASAPQTPGDEVRYPGTCRGLDPDAAARRVAAGELRAWRFRVPDDAPAGFRDRLHGSWSPEPPRPPGDFVVRRADGTPAYQLAVVVDDAAMRITEVVRGGDLLPSTVRQILLFDALGLPRPTFAHGPLLLGTDGARLSKRHGAVAVREWREAGWAPERVVGTLARILGLTDADHPVTPARLASDFDLCRLSGRGAVRAVDPASWR